MAQPEMGLLQNSLIYFKSYLRAAPHYTAYHLELLYSSIAFCNSLAASSGVFVNPKIS